MGLLLKVDERSNRPMFRQIMDQIIALVDSDVLKPGARLPSTRSMAAKLAINRSTIFKAYQELWALGYLESRPGSYSTVRKRPKVVSKQGKRYGGLIEWRRRITPEIKDMYASHRKVEALFRKRTDSEIINFTPLSPDSRLFPMDAFRKCMNHVLVNEGADLLQYGSPLGYAPLREFIAERMQLHGVSISSDEIMITTGAQNAIELLLKLLTRPGDGVVFETPTYSRAIDIFRLSHVKTIEVPMDRDGMDLDALDRILDRESPAMIYTIPNFHNPTGITTDQGHRERLLRTCERHEIPLVEDGFEEEMKYFGRAVFPVKSMDHRGVVIYLGTFSKILFPGLRIGWIAADRVCIDHLFLIQRASILSGNQLDQAALDRFCRWGYYDLHVKRMHRIYRKRMQTALKSMKTSLTSGQIEWTQPAGGYTIWIRLKGLEGSEEEILGHLLDHGVMVSPGSSHYYGPTDGICFRISIAHLEESDIVEGVRRMGRGFEYLYGNTKNTVRGDPCV